GVIAAVPGGGHATFQGSSFAAPFVSATAALIRAHHPQLRQADVVQRLLATADPAAGAGGSAGYGSGVLNPVRAVTELVRPASAQPPEPGMTRAAAPPLATPAATRPNVTVLAAAGGIGLATVILAGLAVITPMGRRRRWRAGTPPNWPTGSCPP
ncbi:MAG: S8 family serine peptidase, partial [Micromonosporaceae bacterium]